MREDLAADPLDGRDRDRVGLAGHEDTEVDQGFVEPLLGL